MERLVTLQHLVQAGGIPLDLVVLELGVSAQPPG